MNGLTITGRIDRAPPRRGPTLATAAPEAKQAPTPPKVRPGRTERLLALAHHIERLIEDGVLKDYADAARRFGLSRARITQVSNLLSLSPRLQEEILTERVAIAERNLRNVTSEMEWETQRIIVGQ